jgi:GNAT superfamily N-acetyltransferase
MVRVRDATVDDARAIAGINVRGWQTAYRGVVPDTTLDEMSIDELAGRFVESMKDQERTSRVLVATDGSGGVLGYASVGPPREPDHEPEGAGEVYAIYVDPTAWGTSVGRELFASAQDALREQGYARAFLWVLDDNPRARRFYEIAGWRWDGARSEHHVMCENLTVVRYVSDL